MTRYYFDILQDAEFHRDEFGIELVDFAEARIQAISLLPDIAQDAAWSDDHHMLMCQVRDDANGIIYEGEITFSGRSIKHEKR